MLNWGGVILIVDYYLGLLDMDYMKLINFLLSRYGYVRDDYFKKASYNKFMRGEIKSIAKGDYARFNEGLYCHHIDENQFKNMSNANYIIAQNIPFEYQRKDRLVYCNLLEHTILHALIVIDTQGRFGFEGLVNYLMPTVMEWYLFEKVPSNKRFFPAYIKSFLYKDEAEIVIEAINRKLNVKIDKY